MSVIAIHSRSERTVDTWQTPEGFLVRTRAVAVDGRIGLDPCTTVDNPCDAIRFYTPHEDGLALSWVGRGLVYCNPPYGRALAPWAIKIATEAGLGAEIVALTPSRTDTKWFSALWCAATAVCFWRGRLRFGGAKDPAPFPSLVWYFGANSARFDAAFGDAGIVKFIR